MKPFDPDTAQIHKHRTPYPHFVVDDLLDEDSFQTLIDRWPAKAQFSENIGFGRTSLRMQYEKPWDTLDAEQGEFWREFIQLVIQPVMRLSLQAFADRIFGKFGLEVDQVILQNFEIAELFEKQLPIPVHSHHYHSPLLCGTGIFYVDDGGETKRGTRLFSSKPQYGSVTQRAEIEASHRRLEGDSSHIDCAATVDFSPNRLLVLSDGPTAWHDAPDFDDIDGPRRQVLFNWGLPFHHTERLYGVDLETYMGIREDKQGSEKVVNWIARDIANEEAPSSLTDSERRAALDRVNLKGHAALDLF